MNSTNAWLPLDPSALRQIDEEAFKRSAGDVALWEHHRAILEGEWRAKAQGNRAYESFMLVRHLPQYEAAEASVIEAWRLYVERTMGLRAHRGATRTMDQPSSSCRERVIYLSQSKQADDYEINRAIILSGCRDARSDREVSELLRERAKSIQIFAEDGNVEFFRKLGRILNEPYDCATNSRHKYPRLVLNLWLTSFLWLMPEKLAAHHLATRLGPEPNTATDSKKALRRFKKTKAEYGLVAHQPSLVAEVTSDGHVNLTAEGRNIVNSLISPK